MVYDNRFLPMEWAPSIAGRYLECLTTAKVPDEVR